MKKETKNRNQEKKKKEGHLVPVGNTNRDSMSCPVAVPGQAWRPPLLAVGVSNRVKPGLKEGTFSPRLVLPVGKPGLKGFPNREQKALLHQWQSPRWRRLTSLWVGGAVGVGNLGD